MQRHLDEEPRFPAARLGFQENHAALPVPGLVPERIQGRQFMTAADESGLRQSAAAIGVPDNDGRLRIATHKSFRDRRKISHRRFCGLVAIAWILAQQPLNHLIQRARHRQAQARAVPAAAR